MFKLCLDKTKTTFLSTKYNAFNFFWVLYILYYFQIDPNGTLIYYKNSCMNSLSIHEA
jgi:hypothetical protein